MSITEKNGLKINTKLFDFVNNEIIPGTNIKTEEFWTNFGNIVHELAPINKKLVHCKIGLSDHYSNNIIFNMFCIYNFPRIANY